MSIVSGSFKQDGQVACRDLRLGSLVLVSPIMIRRLLRRRRHQLAVLSTVFAFGALIAVHHSAPSMGDMDHGGMGVVAQTCLGIFAAVGAAVVAVAVGIIMLARWRPVIMRVPATSAVTRAPAPRGRDGPALLCLLCVCRR